MFGQIASETDARKHSCSQSINRRVPRDDKIRRALGVVQRERGRINLRLRDVAAEVGSSAHYLGLGLKRTTGLKFRDLLREARLSYCGELRQAGEGNFKEIAHRAGYSQYTHLMRDLRRRHERKPAA